jgi:hypothetical protein
MKSESTRIIAMLLLFVIVIGLAMSFGEDVVCAGEPPGAHAASRSLPAHDMGRSHDESDRSGVPSSSHSPNDHICFGVCNGACHAPLASTPLVFTYSPVLTNLCSPEIIQYIPEVFLSLFVPPDSSVA